MEETLKSTMYIQNIVQPILLLFLQQEGDMLCQQDNTHHRMSILFNRLHDVLWPAWCQTCSPLKALKMYETFSDDS